MLNSAAGRLDRTSRALGSDVAETAQRSGVVPSRPTRPAARSPASPRPPEEMGRQHLRDRPRHARGRRIAAEAVDVARSTEQAVSTLSSSSAEISEIVAAITSIAQQTNLLASTRPSRPPAPVTPGRGFAVVAGEVKELSTQTARATEDIERKIAALQQDVQQAASSVAHIGTVVDRLDEIQATVAAAVEEQSAVTGELAGGVSRARVGDPDHRRHHRRGRAGRRAEHRERDGDGRVRASGRRHRRPRARAHGALQGLTPPPRAVRPGTEGGSAVR